MRSGRAAMTRNAASAAQKDDTEDGDQRGVHRGQRGERQCHENEQKHHQTIEEAFEHHRRQGCTDRHALLTLQNIRPQHFACARRIHIIAHIPDNDDREQARYRDRREVTQHVVPAPGTRPDREEIHTDARHEPPVVRLTHNLPERLEIETAKRNPETNGAHDDSQPQLPIAHQGSLSRSAGQPRAMLLAAMPRHCIPGVEGA
jgi:hypothetical protein